MNGEERSAAKRANGRRGARTLIERRGRAHMAHIGGKGGANVAKLYGPEYMARLGRKGGKASAAAKRRRDDATTGEDATS